MLASKSVNSAQDLITALEGSPVNQGNLGTTAAGMPDFQDLTTNAFVDVVVGDTVHISGILPPFTVLTKTDDNNLVFTLNVPATHVADAKWKAKHGGIGVTNLQWAPVKDAQVEGKWHLFYNTATFGI